MKKRKRREELDYYSRLAIARYIDDGLTITQIANLLNRDYQVIWGELKRRTDENGEYDPVAAQEQAIEAKKYTEEDLEKRRILTPEAKVYIEEKLSLKWSPRQIASHIKKDTGVYISYPTIYRYIREGIVKVDVKRDLRRSGKKHNKSTETRGKIKVGDRAIMYRPYFGEKA
ncbi:integrase [Staphylococcus microti]|uniref:Integrase n=1 Tax=Staphylococcus microti TaxID=569857 RepID=A0A0D6XRI8_9STAP|nr:MULTISPECIES: helix-turn-helix domain-containing protein [Staphylococcus]KIX91227.1 integrase [Staphylococcus microti]SUM58297.1 putative transposase [Staphylococcus microti]